MNSFTMTKIVATLGPATSTKEMIKKLFEAGVTMFRLNSSHGDVEMHKRNLSYIREIEKEKKKTEQPQSTPNNSVEKKRKLSFKERQEMQQLETDMEQLNTEKTIIETALNSGSLSPEELVAQSNRIAEIIAILDEKEMRWLELSEI